MTQPRHDGIRPIFTAEQARADLVARLNQYDNCMLPGVTEQCDECQGTGHTPVVADHLVFEFTDPFPCVVCDGTGEVAV